METNANVEPRVHPDLKFDLFLDRWIGAPALALFGFVMLSLPFTVPDEFPDGQSILEGFISAPIALTILWVAFCCWRRKQWYERLSWVFYNVEATPVRVDFGSHGEGGILWARLWTPSEGETKPFLSELFLTPAWSHVRFNGQIILAHVDPAPGGPVVLETADGILWPFGRNRKDLL